MIWAHPGAHGVHRRKAREWRATSLTWACGCRTKRSFETHQQAHAANAAARRELCTFCRREREGRYV